MSLKLISGYGYHPLWAREHHNQILCFYLSILENFHCDWLPVLHAPSISEWQWSIVLLRLISVNYPRFVYDTLMYHFVKFVHWEKSWCGTSRSNAFTALIMSPVVIPLRYYLHNPWKNCLPAVIPVAFPLRSNALINPLWLIPHHRGDSLFRRLSCDVS